MDSLVLGRKSNLCVHFLYVYRLFFLFFLFFWSLCFNLSFAFCLNVWKPKWIFRKAEKKDFYFLFCIEGQFCASKFSSIKNIVFGGGFLAWLKILLNLQLWIFGFCLIFRGSFCHLNLTWLKILLDHKLWIFYFVLYYSHFFVSKFDLIKNMVAS